MTSAETIAAALGYKIYLNQIHPKKDELTLIILQFVEQFTGINLSVSNCTIYVHCINFLHDEDSCQEWCRNWPTESWVQHFPEWIIRRLSVCIRIPRGEDNSMGGLPLSEIDELACHERQSFFPNWESNPALRVQNPVRYPPSYRFTLVSMMMTDDKFLSQNYKSKTEMEELLLKE